MRIWECFPDVANAVRKSHEKAGLIGSGHDFHHALRVGEYAYKIGRDEWHHHAGKLAGLAGLCHNAPEVLAKEMGAEEGFGKNDVPQAEIYRLVREWLFESGHRTPCSAEEGAAIVDAVVKHSNRNGDDDSRVLIALMDADRVVNLEEDLVMRSGQFYSKLPAVDMINFLSDPAATYLKPNSVLRDIAYALDWADPKSKVCVRTRLGKELAAERAEELTRFCWKLKKRLEAVGLYPYPEILRSMTDTK